MEPQSLLISCQGAITVGLDEVNDLQGNLKDLSEENYVKLRNSMLTYGFSFPFFIWVDQEGKKWIIDAHQRKRTLMKMREEGMTIPPLPADIIFAKDRVEAKKKLMLLNSRYGKITREGYDEFMDEEGYEVGTDIEELTEIPEVEMYADAEETEEKEPKSKEITCPGCGNVFTPSLTKAQ